MKYMLLIMAIAMVSCKNQKEMKNEKPEIGSILYEFHDSSVPPPYHRSYSLMVSHKDIKVKVDSYGTILTDTSVAITEAQFTEIANTYTALSLKQTERRDSKGCTGGTGATVKVWDVKDSLIMDGYISFCGGKEYGTMQGDVKVLAEKIKSCIPDFDKMLKRD